MAVLSDLLGAVPIAYESAGEWVCREAKPHDIYEHIRQWHHRQVPAGESGQVPAKLLALHDSLHQAWPSTHVHKAGT
jgi:hypothetical protein